MCINPEYQHPELGLILENNKILAPVLLWRNFIEKYIDESEDPFMRFSPRSKLGIAISVAAILALVGAFAASLFFHTSDTKNANAAAAPPLQRYTGLASVNSNIRAKQYDLKFNSKTGKNSESQKIVPNRL